ncbi:PaaI family thioesterase [Shimia biformata]|uniref:PaaI family thioesterase n=1 Tax=Shimia biformata TaxID=1294299 RepID=UPI00194E8F88|nr:PaaI family thioesterase [Shimia biformata]
MLDTQSRAETFLAENFAPWIQALDLSIPAISAQGVTMTMPITPDLARVGGIVCGQALSALADTAMVFAALAQMDSPRPIATTNLDTQFLRPGIGEMIRCEAHVVRAGKALIFAHAEMIAEPSGKPVATATATFFDPQ